MAWFANRLLCEPRSGHLFLFCSAQRNRLKILVWDGSGLWVCATTGAGTFRMATSHERHGRVDAGAVVDAVRRH